LVAVGVLEPLVVAVLAAGALLVVVVVAAGVLLTVEVPLVEVVVPVVLVPAVVEEDAAPPGTSPSWPSAWKMLSRKPIMPPLPLC
jgi:O-antigen ligase